MAVVENAAFNDIGSSNGSGSAAAVGADHHHHQQSGKTSQLRGRKNGDGNGVLGGQQPPQIMNGVDSRRNGEIDEEDGSDGDGEGFKREKEMRDLEDMLSKLNPMAEEFVPPSLSSAGNHIPVLLPPGGGHFGYDATNFVALQPHSALPNGN